MGISETRSSLPLRLPIRPTLLAFGNAKPAFRSPPSSPILPTALFFPFQLFSAIGEGAKDDPLEFRPHFPIEIPSRPSRERSAGGGMTCRQKTTGGKSRPTLATNEECRLLLALVSSTYVATALAVNKLVCRLLLALVSSSILAHFSLSRLPCASSTKGLVPHWRTFPLASG